VRTLRVISDRRDKISAEDVVAYIAAIAAHPAYVTRFTADLLQPGLRIPITADALLFAEAAALGREVIWLHTVPAPVAP
jgi:predicted helicase